MRLEDHIFLDQLKVEHDRNVKGINDSLALCRCKSGVGSWLRWVFLTWLTVVGYTVLFNLVLERSAGWLAVLTFVVSLLQTAVLGLYATIEMFSVIRRLRWNKKVNKIARIIYADRKKMESASCSFARAAEQGWDHPLTPAASARKRTDKLMGRWPKEHAEPSWPVIIFSLMCYPLCIGWTILGSLALSNVFPVHAHFPTWVVVVGILIACGGALFSVNKLAEEGEFLPALASLVGPLVFAVYMLIATLILLIGAAVSWVISILPVLIIIAVIVIWLKH